jgi:hypothetical protein
MVVIFLYIIPKRRSPLFFPGTFLPGKISVVTLCYILYIKNKGDQSKLKASFKQAAGAN